MTRQPLIDDALPGASPCVLALREELARGRMRAIGRFDLAGRRITVALGRDSLWAISRRNAERLAIRAAFSPGGFTARKLRPKAGETLRIRLESAMGTHIVAFSADETDLPLLRVTSTLTPAHDLLIPHLPRDLYPLGANDDPLTSRGEVLAAQRGMNGGMLYWRIGGDTPGSLLYLQNLTALNPYFNATHTKPDGAVGGEWPELGYLPPTPPQSGTPPVNPLPKGRPFTLSDALIVFHEEAPADEAHSARLFLQMLGVACQHVDRPGPQFHDWPERAEHTARDLAEAPEASVRHYGHLYVHPYTASEYPDSMVQAITVSALHEYGTWLGGALPIELALTSGIGRFFDRDLGTIRRYLPNVGNDKDADAVDSWYLYHPLLGLGRLALDGDAKAKRLFEASLDFAIRAARHFDYRWPIQYKVTDFSVIVAARDDQGLGQTDVGGIYAYVMLVAFELTDDPKYLSEARRSIDAAQGMRFELNYQANLTAWGAAACLRLWRITNERRYLDQSYAYLASFFHNSVIWHSDIGAARHYRTFLGVSALHDGPYMALYECFDSFTAFERLLRDAGPEMDPAARRMVVDYCRYALDRAWFYYPDALPAELLCEKPRNGHIDRARSFPLEDLYVGGDQAGQVGQEIYGAGAAFIFVARCFHRFDGAPFTLFCDHFLRSIRWTSERSLTMEIDGTLGSRALLAIMPLGRNRLPQLRISDGSDKTCRLRRIPHGRIEASLPAVGTLNVRW